MSEPNTTRQFLGGALMTVGALLAGVSGLCMLGYAGIGLMAWATQSDPFGVAMVIIALLSGVVPILVGIGLYFAGKRLRRPKPDV
jgi:hypothetical protein